MKIDVLTIFPEMFIGPLTESLLKKAQERKIVDIKLHNIRSFTTDKHNCVDDRPFGGGAGMVMKVEPIYNALKSIGALKKKLGDFSAKTKIPLIIYLSPQGKPLDQKLVLKLAKEKHLVLLCGHYEGVDERVLKYIDMEVSLGDYVLTGGELGAMVLIDAVSRFIPGVVKEKDSVEQDSFFKGFLDYPNYTRPAVFRKLKVPEILFSGHHSRIEKWRRDQAVLTTFTKRPDLLKKIKLSDENLKTLNYIKNEKKPGKLNKK